MQSGAITGNDDSDRLSQIYYNNGGSLILNSTEDISDMIYASLGLVDYDLDGDLDLLMVGDDGAVASEFYTNN